MLKNRIAGRTWRALRLAAGIESDGIVWRTGKALLGKAVIPDDSIYTTGRIGLLGIRPSQEAIENCDSVLIVGTSFPYIEFYPKPGEARTVQIDIDFARIGLRYPIKVPLLGSATA